MPSYLDLGLIAVVLISALLSMLRGFTREVLAIASWAAAAAAAFYFYPLLEPILQSKFHIQKEVVAKAGAAGIIFFITLVVVSIITVRISDVILDSKIGALDRSLGFVFGAGRGYLLCVIAFVFFAWLVPEKSQPVWVQDSKTKGWLMQTGESIEAMLPENLDSQLSNILSKKKGGAGPEAQPGDDADPGTSEPPAPAGKRTEAEPAAPRTLAAGDRRDLDALVSVGSSATGAAHR